MAAESVYTYLGPPSGPNPATPPHPSQGVNSCHGSRWLRFALWIGWAGNVSLLITVIVLVFQIGQLRGVLETSCTSQRGGNGINKPCLENLSRLQRYLCMSLENTTETSGCKVCPPNWHLHEKKCYWVSAEKLTWNESMEDCRTKLSQMVVIQNQTEMAFLQTITKPNQMLWIGLHTTTPEGKWTWVDDSPCDVKVTGPAEANCGKLNGLQFISEACTNKAMWICEKEALFIQLEGTQEQQRVLLEHPHSSLPASLDAAA